MASEGPGYLDFGRCPKCLATVPKIKYYGSFCGWSRHPHDEHFDVVCWRCGHIWAADLKGERIE